MAPTPRLLIPVRIEELPTIGGFLITSLGSDLLDFTSFSGDYNALYVTNAQTALGTVTLLVQPKAKIAELKVITLRLYNNMDSLQKPVDFLEGYIKRTTGLTVATSDFGISDIRKAANRRDVERLLSALRYTINLAHNATNKPLLQAKGYTLVQQTFFTNIIDAIDDDNQAQNAKVNEINNLTTANYGVINDFWKTYANDISDAGKRIFKKTNKYDDYVIAALKRRVRQEQLRNVLKGTAKLNGSQGIVNAVDIKISMKPLPTGRKRTTKTKADSTFEIKSLVAGEWIVSISYPGYQTINEAVTIVTGETLVKDWVLEEL
jgi:hypothetical protein